MKVGRLRCNVHLPLQIAVRVKQEEKEMREELVEIKQYDGPGYLPLIDCNGWRVAVLNDDPQCYRKDKTTFLERHNETDEVFVLLQGECTLYIGDGKEDAGTIEPLVMEPLKLYNVKKGVWHNLLGAPGMALLIVENTNTCKDNSDYCPVTEDMLP